MTVTPEQTAERLNELLRVARLHAATPGASVRLNGVKRRLNMDTWDCGTSACLLGSYCLTPFGKRYYALIPPETSFTNAPVPALRLDDGSAPDYGNPDSTLGEAAEHFGIEVEDAEFLFMPNEYEYSEDEEGDEYLNPNEVVAHVLCVMEEHGVEVTAA